MFGLNRAVKKFVDIYKRLVYRGKMNNFKQADIAKKAGVSDMMISYIMSGKRRPSWTLAKKLAKVTKTTPVLWLDGTPDEIREKLNNK